jgi:AcrR family transcriptional regulator
MYNMTPVIFDGHQRTMEETLSRRERKKIETRQQLMEVALQLFRDQGYDATTVKQITQAAGVAKGTFFNYFETKEAILPALAEWRFQELQKALTVARGAPASPVARIKMTLCLVTKESITAPALLQRLFAAMMKQREEERIGPAFVQLLAEQVRQAQEMGEIRADLDPLYLGSLIRALFFQQMLMWHQNYRPAPLQTMLAETVDLLLTGAAGPNWQPMA